MAYAVEVTIRIGNDTTANSEEVGISLTYHLERADNDILATLADKTAEVLQGHRVVQNAVREFETSKNLGLTDTAKEAQVIERDEPITAAQEAALRALLSQDGYNEATWEEKMKSRFVVASVEQLTTRQATTWLLELQRARRKKAHHGAVPDDQLNGHSK